MNGLRGAVSFLTRVRVGASPAPPSEIARWVPWFPVVGGLVGLVVASAYAGALMLLPPFVAALVAMACGLFLTGAFHEDGLGDAADALGDGGDRNEALRILKDPTHGTYGVLAIVLSLLLRTGALATLGAATAISVLPAAHALSRAAAAGLIALFRPATEDGVGAAYMRVAARRHVLAALAAGLLIAAGLLGAWALPASVVAGAGALLTAGAARKKIGGITGDILGAAQQIAEILALLLFSAAASNGWLSPAWWQR